MRKTAQMRHLASFVCLSAVLLLAPAAAVTYSSIAMALQSNMPKTTYFYRIAAKAGIDLSSTSWEGTALIPFNDGFTDLFAYTGKTIEGVLADPALCANIVNYHMVPGRIIHTSDFPTPSSGLPNLVVPTDMVGHAVSLGANFKPGPTKFFFVQGYLNTVEVDSGKHDLYLPAGILHFIDKALIPETFMEPNWPQADKPQDVLTIIQELPVLSDLLTLVQKAGLTDYLSSPHLAITLFAPSNSALAQKVKQLGYSSLDQLWGKGAAYLHEMFAGFTVNQVLNDETDMTDLSTYPAMTTPPYQLIIYNVPGQVSVGSPGNLANVISKPLYVDPSVVYVVDKVLGPSTSQQQA